MIEVELPDGSIAEFPAGTPPEVIKQALQKRFGAPQAAPAIPEVEAPSTGMDILRSAGTGLRQGVEGLLGTFGDAAQMTGDVAAWGAGKLGIGESGQDIIRSGARWLSPIPNAPTTEQLQGVSTAAIGEHYQPQTTAGEYARTAGQFAPAAIAGPGTLGRKAAIGAGSALASETAGQLTDGTALEPFARAGGAIVGGLAGARIPVPGRAAPKLPTARDIKDSAGYNALKPEMQKARVTNETYRDIVGRLQSVADDFGLVPEQHAAFKGILTRHAKSARTGTASVQDLEILRRSLNNAGKSATDASARELSRQMVEALDSAIDGLGGANVAVGAGRSAADTISDLKTARETWRTGMKAEMIEQATERARNVASGFENGLRIEFRKILNNKTLSRMFTDTEKMAMRQVVRGTFKGNMMRWLGGFGVPLDNGRNFLGSVIGGGVGAGIGSAVAGPMGAAVGGPLLMGIGTAAKAGSNAVTRNNALFAEALVKGGKQANKLVAEAMMEMRAARNLGLIRSGFHGQQAFTASRAGNQQ